jgi:hypothetical protein
MNKKTFPLLVVLVFGLVSSGFAQLAAHSPSSSKGEFGYYDYATGEFLPVKNAVAQDSETSSATTTVTGTLIFKYTITIKSPIPKNSVLDCRISASISDGSGFTSEDTAFGLATLVSGTTYTCTATMDYSWPLSTASTDKITYIPEADLGFGYQITATNGAGTLVVPGSVRSSVHNGAAISVPTSGTTTTVDLSFTL